MPIFMRKPASRHRDRDARDEGSGSEPDAAAADGGAPAQDPRAPAPDRPLAGRLLLLGTYLTALGAFLAGRRRHLPDRPEPFDLLLGAVATHKISRTIAKEKVAAPLRTPFTEYEGRSDVPAEDRERPARQGGSLRQGVGELLVCPYCLDVWIGTAVAAGFAEAPRQTRFVAGALTIVAASDLLQVAYRRAAERP